jgi:hypothetical protein
MAVPVPFTGNVQDLNNYNGFQWAFRCNRCGNGFRSPHEQDVASRGQEMLRMAARFFGGSVETVSDIATQVTRDRRKPAITDSVRGPNWYAGLCANGGRGSTTAAAEALRSHRHLAPRQYRQPSRLGVGGAPNAPAVVHRHRSRRPREPLGRRSQSPGGPPAPETRECTFCAYPTYGHPSPRDQQSRELGVHRQGSTPSVTATLDRPGALCRGGPRRQGMCRRRPLPGSRPVGRRQKLHRARRRHPTPSVPRR